MDVISIATNTVVGAPIDVGSAPYRVAFTTDGTTAYVVNNGSNSVSVVDLSLGITSPSTWIRDGLGVLLRAADDGRRHRRGDVRHDGQLALGEREQPGAVSSLATAPVGTYTTSGTVADAAGDVGTWSFTLTVLPETRPDSSRGTGRWHQMGACSPSTSRSSARWVGVT